MDRVDGWRNEKDGRLYLRVVDYKTGRKSFDLTEIWNGLGLQLLLYLFTLEREGSPLFGEQPVPAGVLYLPAREAVLKGSRTMDEAARQKELDKELLRKGLILEDADVVEAMEHGEGSLRFLPVKVKTKKDETTISGDALVSAEKLGRVSTYIFKPSSPRSARRSPVGTSTPTPSGGARSKTPVPTASLPRPANSRKAQRPPVTTAAGPPP